MKRLYEHFVKTGQVERAKEILKVYPQFYNKENSKTEKNKKK